MSRCESCGAVVSDDLRPAAVDSSQVFDLYEGARQRGFTVEQIEYLRGCVGITWAKSYRAGQMAGPETIG